MYVYLKKFDTNDDGDIDLAELSYLIKYHEKYIKYEIGPHISAFFAKFDANRDHFISKAEYESAMAKVGTELGVEISQQDKDLFFESADADEDGYIDFEEYDSIFFPHAEFNGFSCFGLCIGGTFATYSLLLL